MAWLKKKSDPLTERARALNSEIAALESQIKKLDAKLQHGPQPRLRSTAVPHGATISHGTHGAETAPVVHVPAPAAARSREPIFEDVGQKELKDRTELPTTPEHFNELGVRKYDVTALASRVKQFVTGPKAANPRLINYLAAGGIQGLQPLRREKRVARNRVIALGAFFLLILVGIIYMFAKNH